MFLTWSIFAHWLWCWPWGCHICPLLCCSMVPLFSHCWEFLSYMCAEVYRMFFYIYRYDHVVFTLHYFNAMYHVYWFVVIVSTLHLLNKSHLILVYDLFNVVLVQCSKILLRILACMLRNIGLWFSLFIVSLSGFGIKIMLAS